MNIVSFEIIFDIIVMPFLKVSYIYILDLSQIFLIDMFLVIDIKLF